MNMSPEAAMSAEPPESSSTDPGESSLPPDDQQSARDAEVTREDITRPITVFGHPTERIGPYRILETVGEGGMGVVYLAEQERPVRRRVALKVIRLGMDTKDVVARFEAERQALAMMDHPNIAKVFDAGATDQGRPYFVMEYVPGELITRYCDRHRLPIRERLGLFAQVCQAIHHAHQKAVIHRDVKPSNVLVSIQDNKPVPKIIDFGIAKATSHRLSERTVFTEQGHLIGTPEYMSPEQAEMTGLNVDTRTDVYSLGVMLYELLTGALPFDSMTLRRSGLEGIQKTIRESEPLKPSTQLSRLGEKSTAKAASRRTNIPALRKQLRHELDWITMRAMEKDRTRRYQSASELAADVHRYMIGDPVLAGPPSAIYRFKKLVARHRIPVAFAGVFLLFVVAFGAWMGVLYARASKAERLAAMEAKSAGEVSDFLVDLFEVSDPSEALGNTITAREILDVGSEKIQQELEDEPLVRSKLMGTLGRVYENLGLFTKAEELFQGALKIREQTLRENDPLVAKSLATLGHLYKEQGRYTEGRSVLERALSIQEKELSPDHPDIGWSHYYLSLILQHGEGSEVAVFHLERARDIFEQEYGPDHYAVSWCVNDLASVYFYEQDYVRARDLFEQALETKQRILGSNHPDVAIGMNNLGHVLTILGDYDAASTLLERAAEIRLATVGPRSNALATSYHSLGELYRQMRDFDQAEHYLELALEIQEETLGPKHPELSWTVLSLAIMHFDSGELDESERLHRKALEIRQESLRPDHPDIAQSMTAYAELLERTGRDEEAEQMRSQAREILEGSDSANDFGDTDP
jgi:serine/threonine protein kinase/tetratricopeptide (TPR) repeat protein